MNRALCYNLVALCVVTGVCLFFARGYISENVRNIRANIGGFSKNTSSSKSDGNTITTKQETLTKPTAATAQRNVTLKRHENGTKIILLWTTWFGDSTWGHGVLGDAPFKNCGNKNCIATADRAYMETADMLLFHCRDGVKQWPTKRLPRQYYAVDCQESQTYSDMSAYRFKANISVTHMLDSDVHFPYFKIVPRAKSLPGPYVPKARLSARTNGAVWLVSHCLAPSKRDHYAKELGRYMNVDIIGACGKNTCPRSKHGICMDEFEKKYKFFLSFENTFCKDYVTEKFSNGLRRDLIPIVFGAANYSHIAPKHSYIDTRDFESPKKLAEFLDVLSKNESAFNEYFQWKRAYTVQSTDMLCESCKFLHDTKGLHREASTFDIGKWWKPPGICDNTIFNQITHTMKPR